jgi:hypothetical protein
VLICATDTRSPDGRTQVRHAFRRRVVQRVCAEFAQFARKNGQKGGYFF